MRQEVPKRALVRRSRNVLLASVLLLLVAILIVTIALFMRSVPLVVRDNPNYDTYLFLRDVLLGIGGVGIVLALLLILRAVTWKQDNPIAKDIGDALEAFLDTRYLYIRNVNKLATGYIDAVLVGPAGVLVFRITNKAGVFFNEGAYWMNQKDKGKWTTMRWSPTKECVTDIKKLREFFQARGLTDVPVFGAVVFTEDEPSTIVTTENPTVPVIQPNQLSYALSDSYFAKTDRIDQLTANKIASLLVK